MWYIVSLTAILRLLQKKNSTFLHFNFSFSFLTFQFLLLVSERGLSPKSCLAICHLTASCL